MTPISRDLLAGTWLAIGSTPATAMSSLLIDADAGVRLAVDPDNGRHLLAPTDLPPRGWSDLDSPLRDSVRTLVFAGRAHKYLDLRCTSVDSFEVFDELVVDVLDALDPVRDVGVQIDDSLSGWRRLFRVIVSARFGRAKRFGLFAELLALEAGVFAGGASVLSCWAGPDQGPHDFEFPKACVEVKALGAGSNAVTIHGFNQLSIDRETPLYLLVYTLSESPQGRTIAELIASVEAVTGVGSLAEGLSSIGYVDSGTQERLIVEEAFAVKVDDQVPALSNATVAGSIRNDVSRVSYELDRSVLSPIRLEQSPAVVIAGAVQ